MDNQDYTIKKDLAIKDEMNTKKLLNRNLLMLLLVGCLSIVLFYIYTICYDSMQLVWKEEYGDKFYSTTNFSAMELSSGLSMAIVLLAGYFMFKKNRFGMWYSAFWLLVLSISDYFIARQFEIYNFQLSTAVSSSFDRYISPALVVLCGLAYAIPLLFSIWASMKINVKPVAVKILLRILVVLVGIVASLITNICIYCIGIICGL